MNNKDIWIIFKYLAASGLGGQERFVLESSTDFSK